MGETFGQFLRARRVRLGFSLRDFSARIKLDPSNYSKYERDVLQPPADPVLKRVALALKLTPRTKDWEYFYSLAAAYRAEVPLDLMRKQRVVELLPVLYQKLRENDLPEGEDPISALVKVLQGAVE